MTILILRTRQKHYQSLVGAFSSFPEFLGAILSVVKDVPVERSAYRSNMELDIIGGDDSLPKDENTESELIIRSVPWRRY